MMNEEMAGKAPRYDSAVLVAAEVALLVVLALIVLGITRRGTSASQLLPLLPTATVRSAGGDTVLTVSFEGLNGDPVSFLGQTIQVSGTFLPLPPDACERRSGPDFRWALVAENLQLDVLGFERIRALVSSGTEMTVQGIWRVYQGPMGCGKGPASGNAWYLQVQKIVHPNPLVSASGGGGVNVQDASVGLPELLPTLLPTATTTPTETPVPTVETTPTGLPNVGGESVTVTATLVGSGTVVPAVTVTPATASPTFDPSVTPGLGTPTATATLIGSGPGASATGTPATPLPPTATLNSGGGYPGAPTATTDPDPYP